MSKLQKRAWLELAGATVCVIWAGIGVAVMVKQNAIGIMPIMLLLVVGSIVGLINGLHNIRAYSKLDEREKKIAIKAIIYASFTFIL